MDNTDRYDILLKAIECERLNEEYYYKKVAQEQNSKVKIRAGLLWQNVEITKKYYTIGEYLELQIIRHKNLDINHKFKVGVRVVLRFKKIEDVEFKATVSYARNHQVRVILNSEIISLDQIPDNSLVDIELIFDERPFILMKNAVTEIKSTKDEKLSIIREAVRNQRIEDSYIAPDAVKYNSSLLNDSQNKAINQISHCQSLGIIHGPPGTGKTTTLVSLIKFISNSEKQILVCAPSNNAVDLLCDKLDQSKLKVIRIGNITRVGDRISHLSLGEKARNHVEWQHIKKVKIEANNARKMALKYKRSFGHAERKERKELLKEAKDLKKWARDLEDRLMEQLIDEAQVVCCTLVGSDNFVLKDKKFKSLIIDEASQALEAESWIAIRKAQRVILAGDHKQLPPTVKSAEAQKLGFEETILDRIAYKIKDSCLLDIQYRMNEKILSFSNAKFYNGLLKSGVNVRNHTLKEDTQILNFIDTSGCGFDENFNEEFKSYYNTGEYFILYEHFIQNLAKYKTAEIGIISPYAEQVRFIKNKISEQEEFANYDIEVNSIDGFQGQEKDVIYISLVRSNDQMSIGFLKDQRRLNVALTRARKKIVIISDGACLSSDKIYLELLEHIEKNGNYISAWEYMG